MTEGKVHDVKAAKQYISIEPDSIYCWDKAYTALAWLKQVDDKKAFSVTRLKNNADIIIGGQHNPLKPTQGVIEDNIIEFCNPNSYAKYPKKMRAIEFYDEETSRRIKDGLMNRINLLELLSISRQNIVKPPDWNNLNRQPDLLGFNF